MTDLLMNDFSLGDVTLLDPYCVNAFEKELEYLCSFDVDRLLCGFRETAGLDTKKKERYSGWENMLIGGHCAGHYLGAAANAILTPNCSEEKRKILKGILTEFIDGLKECQEAAGTGFVFGASLVDRNNIEAQFDNVEKNLTHIITQAWVPWYTMHKIIEGLLGVSKLGGELSEKSLNILANLTDWIYKRVSLWSEQTRRTVLNIEYGGMNDCLYSYYLISGNEKALKCAKVFDDEELFKEIASGKNGENVLNGRHANTTIPKFIGGLNRYLVTGEKSFLEYAEKFWNLVTGSHTYINGGNSTWEHFGEDNNLYSKLSNCNCETCNSYNMLKLTKLLYMITGEKFYADWYEHTFLNSILSSQNPETGMTTYFQPMASGFFKVYSTPFNSFWCCTGTGMENFTKLGESFYFTNKDEKTLYVNQYLSSVLDWKDAGVKVIQKSKLPEMNYSEFTFEGDFEGAVALRIPAWTKGKYQIFTEKASAAAVEKNGCVFIEGKFTSDSKIRIEFNLEITAFNLPDQKDAYAFKYGPVVLCALLGGEERKTAVNGVNVTVPENVLISQEFIPSRTDIVTVKGMTVESFIENINQNLVRDKNCTDTLSFVLQNTDSNLVYSVYYSQYKQRYGLYFRFLNEKDSRSFMKNKSSQGYINSNKLDTVQPGYGQYENDELHNMSEYGNGSEGQTYHGTSRYAKKGGSFSYRMIVDPQGIDLLVQFDPKDNGKSIVIRTDKTIVYDDVVHCKDLKGFNKVIIPVSKEIISDVVEEITYEGKQYSVVKFTVSGKSGEASAQICEFMYTLKCS